MEIFELEFLSLNWRGFGIRWLILRLGPNDSDAQLPFGCLLTVSKSKGIAGQEIVNSTSEGNVNVCYPYTILNSWSYITSSSISSRFCKRLLDYLDRSVLILDFKEKLELCLLDYL